MLSNIASETSRRRVELSITALVSTYSLIPPGSFSFLGHTEQSINISARKFPQIAFALRVSLRESGVCSQHRVISVTSKRTGAWRAAGASTSSVSRCKCDKYNGGTRTDRRTYVPMYVYVRSRL